MKTTSPFIKVIREAVSNMKGPYDEKRTKKTIEFLDSTHSKTQKLLDDIRENKK